MNDEIQSCIFLELIEFVINCFCNFMYFRRTKFYHFLYFCYSIYFSLDKQTHDISIKFVHKYSNC